MEECRDLLPSTAIQVLTNGRAFANSEIVDAWKDIGHPHLMAAIPVYASVDYIHDHVVQAKGAFDETILGILKLKDRGQRVEIRVVLHALTAPIIEDTGRGIYATQGDALGIKPLSEHAHPKRHSILGTAGPRFESLCPDQLTL